MVLKTFDLGWAEDPYCKACGADVDAEDAREYLCESCQKVVGIA